MTKDELKKEAEEKAKKRVKGFKCQDNCEKSYVMGALDFAEPREKRIAELEKENKTMRSEIGIARGYIERIEKENAELKKSVEYWKSEYNKLFNAINYLMKNK